MMMSMPCGHQKFSLAPVHAMPACGDRRPAKSGRPFDLVLEVDSLVAYAHNTEQVS